MEIHVVVYSGLIIKKSLGTRLFRSIKTYIYVCIKN